MDNDKLVVREVGTKFYTSYTSLCDLELILDEFKDNIKSIEEEYSCPKLNHINICFEYQAVKTVFSISTSEIKEILDGIPLSYPKVMLLVKEMIKENIRP